MGVVVFVVKTTSITSVFIVHEVFLPGAKLSAEVSSPKQTDPVIKTGKNTE